MAKPENSLPEEAFKPLKDFLSSLPDAESRREWAVRCGTTLGYLHKAMSAGEYIRERVVINMERESGGLVRCELLRPDVDWAVLRNSTTLSDEVRKSA